MRCFLALPLTDKARSTLLGLQARLRVGKPVPVQNMHVTISFLDEQNEEDLEALHEELCQIRTLPFDLTFRGVGCFGGTTPRVVFASVNLDDNLSQLNRAIQSAIRRSGIILKQRKFHPHVTLARLKPYDAPGLAPFLSTQSDFQCENRRVEAFCLFQSILHPKGANYHELARYPLTQY